MSKKKAKPVQKKATEAKPKTITTPSSRWTLIVLGLGILVIIILRWRLIDVPFERDEGEYAYIGNLILKGIPVYNEAYTLKLPGTPMMYALFEFLFGKTVEGIHIGFLIMNVLTTVLLFLSIRRMFNNTVALCSALLYGFMAFSPTMYGFAAHATHFVNLYSAIAIFCFSFYITQRKWWQAAIIGLSTGMCFLMKQQAVFLIVFGGVMLLMYEFSNRPLQIIKIVINGASFVLGVFIPYGLLVLFTISNGTFDNFWFYTFQYAQQYVSEVTLQQVPEIFLFAFGPMWKEYWPVWILAGTGLILIWVSEFNWRLCLFAILFFIAGFLSISPGFYFRPHYFVILIPSVALLASLTIFAGIRKLEAFIQFQWTGFTSVAIAVLIIILALNRNPGYYFEWTPKEVSKRVYGDCPFIESEELGRYIKANTQTDDRILILGSEPQILFYADRLSAAPYIYTYGLMENQKYNLQMQHDYIHRAEAAKPKYALFINIANSWLIRPDSPHDIQEWADSAIFKKYQVVGLIEMTPTHETSYFWNEDAAHHQPQTQEFIVVLKRREEGT